MEGHAISEYQHADLTKQILACAYEVHRVLGPGFLESTYENAMAHEFTLRGIPYKKQLKVPVYFKGTQVGMHCLDLLVDDKVIVELKAIKETLDIHTAILVSYLAAAQLSVGLILNFGTSQLAIKRIAR